MGVTSSLRCAAKRGVAMSFDAVRDIQKTRRGKVRVLTMEQVQQDGELRGQRGELLRATCRMVCIACAQFQARTKMCLFMF